MARRPSSPLRCCQHVPTASFDDRTLAAYQRAADPSSSTTDPFARFGTALLCGPCSFASIVGVNPPTKRSHPGHRGDDPLGRDEWAWTASPLPQRRRLGEGRGFLGGRVNSRSFVLLLACGILAAGGCAASRQSLQVPPYHLPPSVPGALTHTVRPGETLWSIGKRYGVSYREIMRANGLADATHLPAGRSLVIPPPPSVQARIPLYPNPRWTHIVIHHSALPTGNAKLIDRGHRRRGFKQGLGYHFVIDNGTAGRRNGQIEVGGRWLRQQEGAHCNAGGMNQHGIGICLIGDFTNRQPSPSQMDSLVYLVQQLRGYYRIPVNRVVRHRDVPGKNTECPGDRFPWVVFKRSLTGQS